MVHARAFVPILESDDECGVVGTCTRNHAVAAADGKALQLWYLLYLSLHLLEYLTCLLQRGTLRHTYFSKEHALVLLWHES